MSIVLLFRVLLGGLTCLISGVLSLVKLRLRRLFLCLLEMTMALTRICLFGCRWGGIGGIIVEVHKRLCGKDVGNVLDVNFRNGCV